MILEGIVTTLDAEGRVNVAPMGPIVDEAMSTLHFRPFKSSRTYANLKQTQCGVFHVVDDVLLLARAAIDRLESPPETFPAEVVPGVVLRDACRWYEFRIDRFDDSHERTDFHAAVVHAGRLRDCFGFNRAKHAVLEAAILATRVHLLSPREIHRQFDELAVLVEKTAGPREREAFELLRDFVNG
jgi:uncharacterized protein